MNDKLLFKMNTLDFRIITICRKVSIYWHNSYTLCRSFSDVYYGSTNSCLRGFNKCDLFEPLC